MSYLVLVRQFKEDEECWILTFKKSEIFRIISRSGLWMLSYTDPERFLLITGTHSTDGDSEWNIIVQYSHFIPRVIPCQNSRSLFAVFPRFYLTSECLMRRDNLPASFPHFFLMSRLLSPIAKTKRISKWFRLKSQCPFQWTAPHLPRKEMLILNVSEVSIPGWFSIPSDWLSHVKCSQPFQFSMQIR